MECIKNCLEYWWYLVWQYLRVAFSVPVTASNDNVFNGKIDGIYKFYFGRYPSRGEMEDILQG